VIEFVSGTVVPYDCVSSRRYEKGATNSDVIDEPDDGVSKLRKSLSTIERWKRMTAYLISD
jgi:hypothetical protein